MSYPNTLPSATFSNSTLNRLNHVRHSHTQLSAALPPKSLHLLLSPSLTFLLTQTNSVAFLTQDNLPVIPNPYPPTHPKLLLGVSDNVAYFAIRLPSTFDTSAFLAQNPQYKLKDLRSAAPHLPHHHAAMLAHARSLFEFHQRHQYCGLCGSPTISDHAGSRRRCTRNLRIEEPHAVNSDNGTCNGIWFPRSDPVVIMLVLHPSQQSILLGRSARHPASFYSCLAGFMEHGEALEDAVRREVFEESAIRIGPVRFFSSQPWPFPYSLMLGCIALAENTDINVDKNEIEDAQWFDRDHVADMVKRGNAGKKSDQLAVPPTTSIAGMMCAAYVKSDPITKFVTSSPSLTSSML